MRTRTPDSRSSTPPRPRPAAQAILTLLALLVLEGCAGGGPTQGAGGMAPSTPESVWEALLQPRPEALPGAARVTVSEVLLLGAPWTLQSPLPPALGLQELISAALIRRRDVQFVERRRFSEAAELERQGRPRPRGAPPVGISPGADLVMTGSWAQASADSAYLDFRLTRSETGEVVTAFRRSTPLSADPVALARTVVGGLLEALSGLGQLPAWTDPLPQGAPETYRASDIPLDAVSAFFSGLAAEDRYDWEAARRAYQGALDRGGPGFEEAAVALARVARLRAGGTLGAGLHP